MKHNREQHLSAPARAVSGEGPQPTARSTRISCGYPGVWLPGCPALA